MQIQTAQWYQNHFKAGLQLVGQDSEGELEWIGSKEQWTKLGWLEDGIKEEHICC